MAKILTTKELAAALERIIRKAETEIYLISYSIKIEDSYIKRIKHTSDRNVKIKVVYGESLKKETEKALDDIANIEILQYPGLHAKIFANDNECIIGSMNFYDYSEHHNTELGCLITKNDDKEAFEDALQHCKEIFKDAIVRLPEKKPTKLIAPKVLTNKGYCIRTGIEIPFNIEKPLCYEAYKTWKAGGSFTDTKEFFCHFSGEKSNGGTSVSKPILAKNWKKAQEMYNL